MPAVISDEQLRRRHVRDMVSRLPGHLARLRWSEAQLREERTRRLRHLVRHAQSRSTWHENRLHGVDTSTLTEESLKDLPVMTKDDMMDNFDSIITDHRLTLDIVEEHQAHLQSSFAYLLQEFHAVPSGGSSGRRGIYVYNWDGWIEWYLSTCRYSIRHDRRQRSGRPTVVAGLPAHFITRTFSLPRTTVRDFPLTMPIHEIVAELNALQPDVLIGHPTFLHLLTFEAMAGRLHISPRKITCGSEPLLPEVRAALVETWGVRVENIWGSSEAGGIATSCDEGAHMHLSDDLLIIEPVDEQGRPVAPGEQSTRILLTNLYNTVQPLIRYEITDQVTVLDEPCPCASSHRLISDVQGRLDDNFIYDRGIIAQPGIFDSPLHCHRNVMEYQVRQTGRGADIAIRCAGFVDSDELRNTIIHSLQTLGLPDPQVTITVVSSLTRLGSGKLKRFLPLATPGHPSCAKQ
jgi:phenylacetate-CoA ligase